MGYCTFWNFCFCKKQFTCHSLFGSPCSISSSNSSNIVWKRKFLISMTTWYLAYAKLYLDICSNMFYNFFCSYMFFMLLANIIQKQIHSIRSYLSLCIMTNAVFYKHFIYINDFICVSICRYNMQKHLRYSILLLYG